VGAALALVAVTTAVLAQPQPQFRFYGLPGDSTIDGEIAPVGSTVTATADGTVLGSAVIGEAGTWYVDVEPEVQSVAFTLNGISDDATYSAETVGGSRKVELHVTTPVPEDAAETEEASGEMLEGEDDASMMEAAEDDGSMESAEGDAGDSMMEADDESVMQEETDDEEDDYPVSGTGGLGADGGASWPLAVGVTAALMAAIAGAALMISRRTDSVS
jgi:hypothetical protein